MTSIFVIGQQEKANIRAAADRARAKPIPWEVLKQAMPKDPHAKVLKLEDRCPEHMRPESEHVMLPFGYRVSISYEYQPVGLCLHISMSSPNAGRVPIPQAMAMVLEALDMQVPLPEAHVWLEEFKEDDGSTQTAINVIALIEAAQ